MSSPVRATLDSKRGVVYCEKSNRIPPNQQCLLAEEALIEQLLHSPLIRLYDPEKQIQEVPD